MKRKTWPVALVALSLGLWPQAEADAKSKQEPIDPAAAARLVSDTRGAVEITYNEATGAARSVALRPGASAGLLKQAAAATTVDKQARAADFFQTYGRVFGISNAATELKAVRTDDDEHGGTHLTYRQVYQGLPVFGTRLKSHFDDSGQLVSVNGTFVPGLAVDAHPRRTAEEASKRAVGVVGAALGRTDLSVASTTLLIYREGLIKGVRGDNHLAWEVEVGDGAGVREFVYVDAHTGKVVDQITGTEDALNRRAYDGDHQPHVPDSYPTMPFWVEGQAFPTGNAEADNMIISSQETYDMYSNAFGRDSFDGHGATMDSIFNRGYDCPNASWNGTFISFCNGLTTDDVTGHEWTHAYTQYTHGLIYAWQPGALNEAYSDIFGETLDRINERGGDTPDNPRTANTCSAFTPLPPTVTINSPAAIAGVNRAGTAAFGPQTFTLTNDVVIANDGTAPTNDGCEAAWTNAADVAGKIAFVERGTCGFAVKVKNAQVNGAIGVIVGNNQGGTALTNMAGTDATITVPSLLVSQMKGTDIKGAASTVNATLSRGAFGTDNSVRWLLGEDDTAMGLSGALRDMWSPNCYNNPAKVVDPLYSCGTGDNGGVHNNSGVINHAYALLVDGGTFNDRTIKPIGLTKAAHIYFRAMKVYQVPDTKFADHADALARSCTDLMGKNLRSLSTGTSSGQVITASDCAQVRAVALAVELKTPPDFCNFQPLLAKDPPRLCEVGQKVRPVAGLPSLPKNWTVSHDAVTPADFTPRDWKVVSKLPDGRPGKAFFGVDPDIGTCDVGGDESGVLHLDSPVITIPANATDPRLAFWHWVATEGGFDGGNVKISVNGGPWTLIAAADFVYNPYNRTLVTVAGGNTNPLAGQPAFSGTDGGEVDGSWGRSILKLGPYAPAGSTVQIRFDIGNDGCGGVQGWYIDMDAVSAYQCKP